MENDKFFVAKKPTDKRTVIGKDLDLMSAIALCDAMSPFSVYDKDGKQVYPERAETRK